MDFGNYIAMTKWPKSLTCKKTGRGFLMECLIKVYFTNIDLFGFKRHNINVKHIWSFKKNGNSLGDFVTQTSLTYFRKKSGILDLRTGKDNKFISVFLQRDIFF